MIPQVESQTKMQMGSRTHPQMRMLRCLDQQPTSSPVKMGVRSLYETRSSRNRTKRNLVGRDEQWLSSPLKKSKVAPETIYQDAINVNAVNKTPKMSTLKRISRSPSWKACEKYVLKPITSLKRLLTPSKLTTPKRGQTEEDKENAPCNVYQTPKSSKNRLPLTAADLELIKTAVKSAVSPAVTVKASIYEDYGRNDTSVWTVNTRADRTAELSSQDYSMENRNHIIRSKSNSKQRRSSNITKEMDVKSLTDISRISRMSKTSLREQPSSANITGALHSTFSYPLHSTMNNQKLPGVSLSVIEESSTTLVETLPVKEATRDENTTPILSRTEPEGGADDTFCANINSLKDVKPPKVSEYKKNNLNKSKKIINASLNTNCDDSISLLDTSSLTDLESYCGNESMSMLGPVETSAIRAICSSLKRQFGQTDVQKPKDAVGLSESDFYFTEDDTLKFKSLAASRGSAPCLSDLTELERSTLAPQVIRNTVSNRKISRRSPVLDNQASKSSSLNSTYVIPERSVSDSVRPIYEEAAPVKKSTCCLHCTCDIRPDNGSHSNRHQPRHRDSQKSQSSHKRHSSRKADQDGSSRRKSRSHHHRRETGSAFSVSASLSSLYRGAPVGAESPDSVSSTETSHKPHRQTRESHRHRRTSRPFVETVGQWC